ncbi:DegT/DnrJ/EryC1/StrS family aminotransferase [Planosporangium mesophilum]|uniref:Pyridoxal-5'-phosphate-dependent protein n=1 Tax=Planosporangium mesophilum TaxID=689768 RepID=A0A8J3X1S8_9ACTN|nr:aminotransferase class I/II-fold pyridoxal phosphate-dependent enzyme [Planosporangium mesophilum]NJC81136.1 aminotransferase class I/II-fold pyridoxal phosphate-dependent enzyme [Planosporangium mesophilum]GII21213.1 pyridoxal-5'-phosphate-dependent protein [Planosporangium mesophilum]
MTGRVYLSAPDIGPLEERYLLDAVRSGWVAPLGPSVDAFEREMAERVGVAHAVALSSGTAALHLALLGLGVGPGDVVVVPTLTFAATANAVVYTGAEPVFVDCDPATGNLDAALLADTLVALRSEGRRVGAVVPVDLFGRCADYAAILPLCAEYGVPVVEDAAEALGATYRGAAAGSFGRAAVLSFNGNKIMTTSGGGMLLSDDAELAAHARYLATQARQPVVHYEHTDIGYNYRLSNLLAALGRAQLARLDEMIERRRGLRDRYAKLFAGVDGVSVLGDEDDGGNCWLTVIVVDPATAGWCAGELSAHLSERDIETRPVWKPMHLQPVFAGARSVLTGAAARLFETGLTLPSGSALDEQQIGRVCDAIAEFVGNGQ